MQIPVSYYEEIDEHEFITGYGNQRILARDVETRYINTPTSFFGEYRVWNGKQRDIRKIRGKWYLITKLTKIVDNK